MKINNLSVHRRAIYRIIYANAIALPALSAPQQDPILRGNPPQFPCPNVRFSTISPIQPITNQRWEMILVPTCFRWRRTEPKTRLGPRPTGCVY